MADRCALLVDLTDRPCLVVGGGTVAARKAQVLVASGAQVTVLAPSCTPDLVALVASGVVRWVEGRYTTLAAAADGQPWRFVVAATDDPAVNDQVAADAEEAGVWANHGGAGDGGAAALPAVARSGPVTVAVSTGGIHPGAARWLADQALAAIGAEPAIALTLIDQLRQDDPQVSGSRRRPDWRCVVDSGTLELIREGHLAEAKERLEACLSSSSD